LGGSLIYDYFDRKGKLRQQNIGVCASVNSTCKAKGQGRATVSPLGRDQL
jgi:hypothetical protein